MNKNIIIVLAGGFLVAILVAILLQSALSGSKKEKSLDTNRVEILVAAKDLKIGSELIEGDLKWQEWPKDTVFEGAIIREENKKSVEAAKGKLLRSLAKGQPMHSSLIIEDNKGDFLSANVQKGMRAVGISVRSHVLADRLIRPGDYVDVMVTYQVKINGKKVPQAQSLVNRYATETVIENVRVLAIDNKDTKMIDEEEEEGKKSKTKASKTASLTLEVKPEDAEKLVLANRMGDIGLALRSLGDTNEQQDDKTTTDVGMSKVMTKLSDMGGTGSNSSLVRIYSGDRMTEVTARNQKVKQNDDELTFDMRDEEEDYPDDDEMQTRAMEMILDAIRN